ncbi:HTH_Tnp_Tc3_2 domain-containing protein [Trichonephila clavipes]|nr:HTH_Tnp_Tc3_2 domain-containing protein [Trichonephila clavipes]
MEDFESWRDVGRIEEGQLITDVARFFGVHHSIISRLLKQFQTTQTVVRRRSPKGYNPRGKSIYCFCRQAESQKTSTRVTSVVTTSIGKAISAATVRRRLHMNGLYARVSRVCVPLSIQSRGAGLKWCREHGNWTVPD